MTRLKTALAAEPGASAAASDAAPLRLGVSACLLGRSVRFDGGHKHDRFLTGTLGQFVEWVPVCPEVEIGMGVPRETVRLVRVDDGVRMRAERSGSDHTVAMTRWARRRVRELERLDLCGYVLKKGSPSCGMERVRLYGAAAVPDRSGRGLFAAELMQRLTLLPVEEEGRLCDAPLRENFVERIFAFRRLRGLFAGRWSARDVVAFHTAHKLQVMAHSPVDYRALGRLVAAVGTTPRAEFHERYSAGFMAALARRATPRRHVNVLQHALGYLRKGLDQASRAELAEVIEDYGAGLIPLIVPITLLRHHVRHLGIAYLEGQRYLEPHPRELMLRNHV